MSAPWLIDPIPYDDREMAGTAHGWTARKRGMATREERKRARATGTPVRFVAERGKGSHGTLYYGTAFTIVKDRRKEISRGLLRKMLRDLSIDPKTF